MKLVSIVPLLLTKHEIYRKGNLLKPGGTLKIDRFYVSESPETKRETNYENSNVHVTIWFFAAQTCYFLPFH